MESRNIPITKVHSYNVSVAADVGINAAVIFYNICFWVEENTANERNFINGEYWTYNTVNAFKTLFPEMSYEQVRNALRKLENAKYIKSAFLNEDTRDRTKWYTVIDKDKWITSNKCICENSHMDCDKSQKEHEKSTDDNNIYNNININTDNKQSVNKHTDNSHKADTSDKSDVKVYTSSSKKRLPEPERKKTKSELKELEKDMIKRFDDIGCQYDVSGVALDNIIKAFTRYLEKYSERTGRVHPILKDDAIEKIFLTMATISDTQHGHFENIADYEPDENGLSYLDKIVDEHFRADHGEETDYHITHFANGEYLEKMARHIVEW